MENVAILDLRLWREIYWRSHKGILLIVAVKHFTCTKCICLTQYAALSYHLRILFFILVHIKVLPEPLLFQHNFHLFSSKLQSVGSVCTKSSVIKPSKSPNMPWPHVHWHDYGEVFLMGQSVAEAQRCQHLNLSEMLNFSRLFITLLTQQCQMDTWTWCRFKVSRGIFF